jgi:hypothetical protein
MQWLRKTGRLAGLPTFALLGLLVTTGTPSGASDRSPADTLAAAAAQVQTEPRLKDAIEVMSRVPAGRILLEKGRKAWSLETPGDLIRVLRWGEASRTDAVLTRHLDSRTGKEYREREITIYLKRGQPIEDLVLDLAHELVHATSRPDWDPYDPQLTAGKYIHATIEGAGGEVDAVMAECQVGIELALSFGTSAKRCRSYLSSDSKDALSAQIDRDRVRKDFYRVGDWGANLNERLGKEREMFPLLSVQAPKLFSSTGRAPYPVALLAEFDDITRVACENTIRRVKASAGRAPAESGSEFLAKRCSRFLADEAATSAAAPLSAPIVAEED